MLVRLNPHGRQGIVLAMVLILALLLSTAMITFLRQSVVDKMVAHNRDSSARAEALARGGIRLAAALILDDALIEADPQNSSASGATLNSRWNRIDEMNIETDHGGTLHVKIVDTGSRLNLNALVDPIETSEDLDQTEAEEFLVALIEKVIAEIELPEGEKFYDPRDLARSLIDYIDPNTSALGARGSEDDYYQKQTPPYQAANRPLLSVTELRLVEGFDAKLVDALTPYVTVYPLGGRAGLNINTAPPHALTTMYHGTSTDRRLVSTDSVQQLLKLRDEGRIVCDQTEADSDRCVPLGDLFDGSLYPPVTLPSTASTFEIVSTATFAEITRQLEVVLDRSDPSRPRLLSWRYR